MRTAHRPVRGPEAGQAMLLFAVGLAALVTLLAVVVNLGHVATVQGELQHAAGQAAIAATSRLGECPKDSASVVADARARALEVAAANRVAGSPLLLDPIEDVRFGQWNPVNHEYTRLDDEDAFKANAVEVLGRRTDTSPSGAVELFMGGLLGRTSSEGRSRAFGLPEGPAVLRTDLTIGLNECAVLDAFEPGSTDPVPFPLELDYRNPDFSTAAYAATSGNPDARDLAICPPPIKPVYPQQIADPFFSSDPACSNAIASAQQRIRYSLFCELQSDPPGFCDNLLGDALLGRTIPFARDLLLINNFSNLPWALYFSEGDLQELTGDRVLPVYSSVEIGDLSDFDSGDTLADRLPVGPVTVPAIPLGSMLVTYFIDVTWPPFPTAVRYSPLVGFAKYRVDTVQPIFEVITYPVHFELSSCENQGLCTIPNCCSFASFPTLDLEVDLEQIVGLQIDGAILRDVGQLPRRAGGIPFGMSTTRSTGPRLGQPSNLADVPPTG